MGPDRTPVICGIGLSDHPVAPHLDAVEHNVQAMRRALDDSGVRKSDIDGYMFIGGLQGHNRLAVTMAEYLGLEHAYINNTMTGGSSYTFYLQHAAAAIRQGLCETILVTYGSDMLSRHGSVLGTTTRNPVHSTAQLELLAGAVDGPQQFELPYGNTEVGIWAMIAQRHMYRYGTTAEQLAEIAVAARYNASLNLQAMFRDPITCEDVVNSKVIADPLHKLDCCITSDGGASFIITTAERAKDLKSMPVYVLGAAGSGLHFNFSQMPDYTSSPANKAAAIAFQRAGVSPKDIDLVQLYDIFTITVLVLLEDIGFCEKGEGGRFVENGTLRVDGKLPFNTDGGALSAWHTGVRSIFLIVEAVRQLRGQGGESQVPNARLALCAGAGGWLSAVAVGILGKDHP